MAGRRWRGCSTASWAGAPTTRRAGARKVFAITEETFECPAELSAGGRNLMRAGFRLVNTRTVWQPPGDLLHPRPGRLPDI